MSSNEEYLCYGNCEVGEGQMSGQGEYAIGNVTKEIYISKDTEYSELRADMVINKVKTVRIWGQINDCQGNPVKNGLLKLVKEVRTECGKIEYVGVAHGITDCLGFYQFDVCVPTSSVPSVYRIFVSKQALGKEGSIKATECDPCKNQHNCAR